MFVSLLVLIKLHVMLALHTLGQITQNIVMKLSLGILLLTLALFIRLLFVILRVLSLVVLFQGPLLVI